MAIGVLAGFATTAGGAAAQSVPDASHHVTVDATTYPWSSVAKLFNSVGGSCTAAVVAPDKLLTAAHCLYNFRTQRFLPPDAIHVLLGYARGDYAVHAQIHAYRTGPGYDPTQQHKASAQDWAILDLAEPLPGSIRPLRPFEGTIVPNTRIMIGGFARDRAYLMTADDDCSLLGTVANGSLMTHDCVIAPGDSGAPLLMRQTDGDMRVLGVAVGIRRQDGRSIGIAIPVPTEMKRP